MSGSPSFRFSRDARSNTAILALLALGFLALMTAGIAVIVVQQRTERDASLIEHTLAVENTINDFVRMVERTETARRGTLIDPAGGFLPIMAKAIVDAQTRLTQVKALTADNPAQQARAGALQQALDRYFAEARQSLNLDAGRRAQFYAQFHGDPGVLVFRSIRAGADRMMAEETRLLEQRNRAQDTTRALYYAILALCAALIGAIALITLAIMRRNIRDIEGSRAELHAMNTHLEELVTARTAELQRANAEIQRFAYIVSHDLRAPLVNVMGFTAELEAARQTIARQLEARRENGEAPPEDVQLAVDEDLPEAIGFIRSSTQRMDRLINAILRLSREGRRTLSPAPLDLSALVHEIVGTLQHRIHETGTEVTVDNLPTITSDRLAVEQILSNLIENALKYLDPKRPGRITVSAESAFGQVRIAIADNGRGIEPRDHERVFDLFRRSGAQDQPGEGIGLAHVRALAYRLGGFVEISSTPGEGSTFTVVLPLHFKPGDTDARTL
ncbi:MAG: hypothetical protein RIS94_2163 [Pseudomonadota bacterium]|jgi:signal transduction histidine kinase